MKVGGETEILRVKLINTEGVDDICINDELVKFGYALSCIGIVSMNQIRYY